MNKQHILAEIKRTAQENGGIPLGWKRFFSETGIRYYDWFRKHWSRWGDAVREAGFEPNKLTEAYGDGLLIERYIGLVRELSRIPVKGELRLKKRNDPSFPNEGAFERFGSKSQLLAKVLEYCSIHSGFDDVAPLCAQLPWEEGAKRNENGNFKTEAVGMVYLLRSGRHYKIGRTNAVGRREYELAIQLPAKAKTVHVIRTDDPTGIEAYWHNRFAAKRSNGEWFELDSADVAAFKRRKLM